MVVIVLILAGYGLVAALVARGAYLLVWAAMAAAAGKSQERRPPFFTGSFAFIWLLGFVAAAVWAYAAFEPR